jgi:hypothetical protein
MEEVSGQLLSPAALSLVPIEQEAEWAPELVWILGSKERSRAPAGNRIPEVQPIARHYTDWANPILSVLIGRD